MANLVSIACTIGLRCLFSRENKRRDIARASALHTGVGHAAFEEFVAVKVYDSEGREVERRMDKMYLDLTDGENLAFRYVL